MHVRALGNGMLRKVEETSWEKFYGRSRTHRVAQRCARYFARI